MVYVKSTTDVNGKLKATTVNVTGVLIDGIGYGASMIKKVGSVPVTVEYLDGVIGRDGAE